MSIKRAHLQISGRVQGVFYRGWTADQAHKRDLKGWVRNRFDGSVEAAVEHASPLTTTSRSPTSSPPVSFRRLSPAFCCTFGRRMGGGDETAMKINIRAHRESNATINPLEWRYMQRLAEVWLPYLLASLAIAASKQISSLCIEH